jgi:hypothetical protein
MLCVDFVASLQALCLEDNNSMDVCAHAGRTCEMRRGMRPRGRLLLLCVAFGGIGSSACKQGWLAHFLFSNARHALQSFTECEMTLPAVSGWNWYGHVASVGLSGFNHDMRCGVCVSRSHDVGCHTIVGQMCLRRKFRTALCVHTCLHVQQGLSCLVQFCRTSVYLRYCKVLGAAARPTPALPVCIAAWRRIQSFH